MRNREADNLVSSESSDGEFLFDKVKGHRGANKIQTKVTKDTLNQMDNTVTVNDVMSSHGKDEKNQELNIVSPHFSSEKNET